MFHSKYAPLQMYDAIFFKSKPKCFSYYILYSYYIENKTPCFVRVLRILLKSDASKSMLFSYIWTRHSIVQSTVQSFPRINNLLHTNLIFVLKKILKPDIQKEISAACFFFNLVTFVVFELGFS